MLPGFITKHSRNEKIGLCVQIHGLCKANDEARLLSNMEPGMKPSGAFAKMAHGERIYCVD